MGFPQPEMLTRRLEQLAHLGLAEPVADAAWELADRWQDELRELGFRGDRLKQIHRALHGADPARFHVVGPGQGIPDGRGGVVEGPLVGRLARKGLADESKGTYYAVLETAAGAVYHVRLPAHAVDALEPGALVIFSARRRESAVRPVDRHLAGVAVERGGIYEIALDASPTADPKAIRTRLRQLEGLGLATLERPDRWRLAANLLEQLEIRQRETPRYQLSIEPTCRSAAPVGDTSPRQIQRALRQPSTSSGQHRTTTNGGNTKSPRRQTVERTGQPAIEAH